MKSLRIASGGLRITSILLRSRRLTTALVGEPWSSARARRCGGQGRLNGPFRRSAFLSQITSRGPPKGPLVDRAAPRQARARPLTPWLPAALILPVGSVRRLQSFLLAHIVPPFGRPTGRLIAPVAARRRAIDVFSARLALLAHP